MAGERATSRLTLDLTVIHDGDPQVVAEHVAVEVAALLERWGCDPLDTWATASVILPGDDLSPELPAIGRPGGAT